VRLLKDIVDHAERMNDNNDGPTRRVDPPSFRHWSPRVQA
jgi:hypothetical protein